MTENKSELVWVVAYNLPLAKRVAEDNGLFGPPFMGKWNFLFEPQQLFGCKDVLVLFGPGWQSRKNIAEIMSDLERRGYHRFNYKKVSPGAHRASTQRAD